jgi:hypothetical protein
MFVSDDEKMIRVSRAVAENKAGAGARPCGDFGFEANRREQHVLGDGFDFHDPLKSRPCDDRLFERNLIIRAMLELGRFCRFMSGLGCQPLPRIIELA